MKGYIFEYYQYFRCTDESLKGFQSEQKPILNYDDADKSILTFGDYDRLKINVVEDFTRYRDFSILSKTWFGNRQSMLLYELNDNYELSYRENPQDVQKSGFFKNEEQDKHLFWALTEFPFRNQERSSCESYKKLLESAKTDISKVVSNSGIKNLDYVVFGTLGTFGIVVLWLGDQFTDILELVNSIKNQSSVSFLSAQTIFSKNPLYNDAKSDNQKLVQLNGSALVYVTLKKSLENVDIFPFYVDIPIVKTMHTPGEYDFCFEMSAKDAVAIFENSPFMNHDADEYQQYFLQTKVILCRELKSVYEANPVRNPATPKAKNLVGSLLQVKKVYKDIRKLLESKVVKTAGLIDTLDSLICDYRANVISAVNEGWAEDFSYVFEKNLECIQELLKTDPNPLVTMRVIMNNLKQQIFHIAEANNLELENPKCHLRYTGQEDGVLFCYMGIIKEILYTAYQLNSVNKQSEIIPVVTVDVVPIIESELYFDKVEHMDNNEHDMDCKILSLNLPHVSFYEIPIYFQYMYHEIYHYIVPVDREYRDYIIGIILSAIYVQEVLKNCLKELLKSTDKAKKIVWNINGLILQSIEQNYMMLHGIITSENGIGKRICERDTVLFIEDKYIKELLQYLQGKKHNDFIERCLSSIRDGLKKPQGQTSYSYEELKILISDQDAYELLIAFFEGEDQYKLINSTIADKEIKQAEPLQKYLDGLKEVSADISMIDFTEMPLSEYLLFYVNCPKTSMYSLDNISNINKETKEYIRIGIILDAYKENQQYLENNKSEFIYKFIARYFHWYSSITENGSLQREFDKLYAEAEEWFKLFNICQKKYKQIAILSPLFREYCKSYHINYRMTSDEIHGNVKTANQLYFNGYRSAIRKFAEDLEKFHSQISKRSLEENQICYEKIKDSYIKTMFQENITLFQNFQKQRSLKELHNVNDKKNNEKASNYKTYKEPTFSTTVNNPQGKPVNYPQEKPVAPKIKEYNVTSFEEFAREIQEPISLIRNSIKYLLGETEAKIWYRGQSNAKYGLLPSIMRRTTNNKYKFNYLAQYQRYLFGEFKFQGDGTAEMHDRSHYGISDYLALMQHYGVSTNLMDWSENAFTALYFALENVLINQTANVEHDAALWIFSPQLYNEARKYMILNEAGKAPCTEAAYRASMKTTEGYDGMIPNISVSQNESLYDMFLLGNIQYESPNQLGYQEEKKLNGRKEMAYLPVAAYTSRLNPRIKAQSGIFVAFNLYTEPSKNTEYDYMALNKIQDYYFQCCERKTKEQFLYKIQINKDAVKDIAACVGSMGINTAVIYPELENIGKKIK